MLWIYEQSAAPIQLSRDMCICGDDYGSTQLFKIANDYAKENFTDVNKNQEFLLLNVDQIVDILNSDDLNVSSEEEVFHTLFVWINHNPETRKQKL